MERKTEYRIIISGFGGQGILFAGRFLVNACMLEDRQVTWMPSYGPEMRGGTAYCSVVVSDSPIGSPVVSEPDMALCLNGPSFDKFENSPPPGGWIFVDNTFTRRETERKDIQAVYIPSTKIADDNNIQNLANLVMMGKMIKETGICGRDILREAIARSVSARRANLIDSNIKAIELGYNYDSAAAM